MKNRFLCALMAVLFVFSAAGCSSAVNANDADTAAVRAAIDKFAACESFSIRQVTDSTEVSVSEGEEYKYVGSNVLEISIITTPQLQMSTFTEIEVKADEGTMGQETHSYLVPENGGYTEYFGDGSQWYKLSTDDVSALEGLNARVFTSSFFVDVIDFGKAGEDTLDSGKALRYEGTLDDDDLLNVLESVGYFNSFSSMSENQQARIHESIESNLGEVTVKVWVDEASGYPMRFEVSLTDILKDLEKSVAKALGEEQSSEWAITDYVISMTAGDFNSLSSIELPEEAKSATPYEG